MRCVAASLRGGDTLTVVADHVGVESLALLRSVAGEIGARVIVNDGPKGKKYAQRAGVNAAADGSVVVCVDADCAVGGRFGESVRAAAEGIGGGLFMLLLPVEMSGGWSLFGRLVELEFGCLQVVTAGTALAARPTMANGAGMAFPKELYSGHDARTDYASGDDMFLLAHALRKRAVVRYLTDRDAVVTTAAPSGVEAYLRQRTRWLAKAGGYRSAGVIVLALLVFVAVMAWPVAAVCAACGWLPAGVAACVFVAKLAADGAACASWIMFRSGRRGLRGLWLSVPLEIVYPLMTVVVAMRALVADKARW